MHFKLQMSLEAKDQLTKIMNDKSKLGLQKKFENVFVFYLRIPVILD